MTWSFRFLTDETISSLLSHPWRFWRRRHGRTIVNVDSLHLDTHVDGESYPRVNGASRGSMPYSYQEKNKEIIHLSEEKNTGENYHMMSSTHGNIQRRFTKEKTDSFGRSILSAVWDYTFRSKNTPIEKSQKNAETGDENTEHGYFQNISSYQSFLIAQFFSKFSTQ